MVFIFMVSLCRKTRKMDRTTFLKIGSLLGGAGILAPLALGSGRRLTSTYDVLKADVGFNHLPNNEEKKMQKVIHRAATRGQANHGWLQSRHTFSFANYRNPERMHFGVLRVLNDDHVTPGQGFGTHPHDNMEIITIPLNGSLEHKDSMGNTGVIRRNEIQVMSAGTGVFHSEYNASQSDAVEFLQIWLFPNQRQVTPRYDQLALKEEDRINRFSQILSPSPEDEGVWIHQNAWFHLGKFDANKRFDYALKNPENGVYAFILSGDVSINGESLHPRDGMGIWEINKLNIHTQTEAEILLMEVPMTL
jgi:quercetin 2,3-dioxygenase